MQNTTYNTYRKLRAAVACQAIHNLIVNASIYSCFMDIYIS